MRVKDNWEYVQDFCNDFGRLPKDADELEYFLSYVDEKRHKTGRDTTKMMETPVSDDLEKSEQPINQDDIDAEIGHWMDRLDDKYCMLVNHYSIQDIKDTARHFYELGRQSECMKVKAESALDKFVLENCTHCTIEHCPGMMECYTSSNKQLQ